MWPLCGQANSTRVRHYQGAAQIGNLLRVDYFAGPYEFCNQLNSM
jgi:hypothetical protein